MDLLCLLAAEPGRTFTRGELREGVWRGVVVGEAAIDRAVCCLRRALGDDARAPRLIETVRKRGVRLRVAVTPVTAPPVRLAAETAVFGPLHVRYELPVVPGDHRKQP